MPSDPLEAARLACDAHGWSDAERRPLLYALRWLPAARLDLLDADGAAFADREGRRWAWRRGRGFVAL